MNLQDFNVGDRVEYVGHSESARTRSLWAPSFGVVTSINDCHIGIDWDKDSKFFRSEGHQAANHYPSYLKLHVLKYDPNQQGDNDDDI